MGLFGLSGDSPLGPRLIIAFLLLPLAGCLTTRQGFEEKIIRTEYSKPDENGDQYIIAEDITITKVIDKAKVPPFNSTGDLDHRFEYKTDDWSLTVSTQDYLEGGDIAEVISELIELVKQVKELIEQIHPATSILNFPLQPTGEN